MTKRYNFSVWWCESCQLGLEDEEDTGEGLSVYDAALIWVSHSKDTLLDLQRKNWKTLYK